MEWRWICWITKWINERMFMLANSLLGKSNDIALKLSSIKFGFIFLIFVINFLLWVWYLYVFACVPLHVGAGKHVPVGVRDQCWLSSCIPFHFMFWGRAPTEPGVHHLGRPASSSRLLVSVSRVPGIQVRVPMPSLCVNAEDPNPGPHADTAGPWLTPLISLAPVFHSHRSQHAKQRASLWHFHLCRTTYFGFVHPLPVSTLPLFSLLLVPYFRLCVLNVPSTSNLLLHIVIFHQVVKAQVLTWHA